MLGALHLFAVASCAHACATSDARKQRMEQLSKQIDWEPPGPIWSKPPLVYFMARCSGSTFTFGMLKPLLALHGVHYYNPGYGSSIDFLKNSAQRLSSAHDEAQKVNKTLMFNVHVNHTFELAAASLRELQARVVHMYRANTLDRMICAVRDGIDHKDYHAHLGAPRLQRPRQPLRRASI